MSRTSTQLARGSPHKGYINISTYLSHTHLDSARTWQSPQRRWPDRHCQTTPEMDSKHIVHSHRSENAPDPPPTHTHTPTHTQDTRTHSEVFSACSGEANISHFGKRPLRRPASAAAYRTAACARTSCPSHWHARMQLHACIDGLTGAAAHQNRTSPSSRPHPRHPEPHQEPRPPCPPKLSSAGFRPRV